MKVPNWLVYLSIVSVLFISCEKEAINVKLPHPSPKLVVTSFISPQDTLILVKVSESRPIFGVWEYTEDFTYKEATVILSDGTESITLDYNDSLNLYMAAPDLLPIEAGKSYYLKISAPDGRAVEASCTVPKIENVNLQLLFDTLIVKIPNLGIYDTIPQVHIQWQDPPGINNFYRVAGYMMGERITYSGDTLPFYTELYSTYNEKNFIYENEWLTDENIDGNILFSSKSRLHPGIFKLEIFVLFSDKAYYQYHQMYNNDYTNDPFTEPILMYTNIKGGLGVFCAYNQLSAVYEKESD